MWTVSHIALILLIFFILLPLLIKSSSKYYENYWPNPTKKETDLRDFEYPAHCSWTVKHHIGNFWN